MSARGREEPVGWCWVQLGELLEAIEAGKSPKAQGRPATGDEYGVLKVSAVTWGRFDANENKALNAGETPRPVDLVRKGDLLISRANTVELVGAVVLVDEDHPRLMLSDKTLRLEIYSSAAHKEYLLHALRAPWVREVFEDKATGTSDSMRNLSQDKIRSAPILLPPVNEQRRIVAKIDALQAHSRRAREALDSIPALLERFRQSVLAAAFRGDLTADWRAKHPDVEPASVLLERIRAERKARWIAANPKKAGKYVEPEPVDPEKEGLPELPEGWCWSAAEDVVHPDTIITYGIVLPGPQIDDGVPYVRGQDIVGGTVLIDQLKRTSPELAATKPHSALQTGDVLLCIIRHLRVAIVPPGIDGANITQGAVRLRPSFAISGPYLAGYLAAPMAQQWMKGKHFGLAMPRINVEDARRVPVAVPPMQEQQRIVEFVAKYSRAWAAIEEATGDNRLRLDTLDQSILAKAFRGELVPQDPNDEPASVLLDRIKAERSAQTSKPRARRRSR